MITALNITRHGQLRELLKLLQADTQPLWGKMTAQQMLEHLVDAVRFTNGTLQPTCDFSPDEAFQRKQRAKAVDGPIPRNINLGDLPETLEFPDLSSAKEQLLVELVQFDKHFKTPGREEIHSGFGPMDHQEWIWWHSKHFTHHFTQFGLIV